MLKYIFILNIVLFTIVTTTAENWHFAHVIQHARERVPAGLFGGALPRRCYDTRGWIEVTIFP